MEWTGQKRLWPEKTGGDVRVCVSSREGGWGKTQTLAMRSEQRDRARGTKLKKVSGL